ncbi:YbjN domain-containing protein [Aureispira anguillae]|uniref:YbjN domain-containing protein n=1 Tax=Aureispira anguillae TaxID=2864201 RepID=A0A915YKS2_9BACT|nr:YbjN domain-containing protein [Aureispira anguillae]BDS14824.1 YbjN domain-containing protein [Aureispira anguillae]
MDKLILKKLGRYFKRIGVDYDTDQTRQALSFDVETPEGEWQCLVLVGSRKDARCGVGFYSTLPTVVPIPIRDLIALSLMSLNTDRLFGSFELDPDTGYLHFKTYIEFDYRNFSEKALEKNMLFNIEIMRRHMLKLTKMIHQRMANRA